MDITCEELRKKIQELFPDRSYNLTTETLENLCSDSTSKDFLKWFCSELSQDNVLTEEEIKLTKQLKKSGKWLEGGELDAALAEITGENPDLLQILESDITEQDLFATFSASKIAHDSDQNYLQSLENGIQNLKKIENNLDEQLEKEQDGLEKLKIGEKLAYEESLELMEKFNSVQRQLSEQVEQLVSIYTDACQKKGPSCVWTQMPLDLFTKRIETYNEYLKIYIKTEFGTSTDEVNENERSSSINTEPDLNLDYSNEKQNLEKKILELRNVQQRLHKSKLSEILSRGRKEATQAMVNYAQKIYNGGNVLMPRTLALLRADISELKIKRDNLEKQVTILKEHQIPEAVNRFVHSKLSKILVENAKATQERREHSIEKLGKLLFLAKNQGHLHSDLLYILIELENQKLTEVLEFVSDVRNYLEMEYSSADKRSDWMRKATVEISSPFAEKNVFNKYLMAMMQVEEGPYSLEEALEKFQGIVQENEKLKENLTETMSKNVNLLRTLDRHLLENYNREIQSSGGSSLELEIQIHKTEITLSSLQTEMVSIRNKLKEMMDKTGSLEREKATLWQKFLAEPETLNSRYEELLEMSNQTR